MKVKNVIFDLGGVLIDWNPEYLYSKIFYDQYDEMRYFLEHICTYEWNCEQDAGRTFGEAVRILTEQYPDYAALIRAYDNRWDEMLGDAFSEVVDLLKQVKTNGWPLYALTNWSAEKFPVAYERFPFLSLFDGILVSGEVMLKKPDLKIFKLMLDKYNLNAGETLFIDDSKANIDAAENLQFITHHYTTPASLRSCLRKYSIIK